MAADDIHITFHDHWSEVLLKFRCMSRTGKSLASSPKGWSISYDMWELAKKIWSKKNFCVGECFNGSKTPIKKRHTCWTSECVRSIGTIFPVLDLIGWSNSMDSITNLEAEQKQIWNTIILGFHHLRMSNCNPSQRKKIMVTQVVWKPHDWRLRDVKEGPKCLANQCTPMMSWIKQNGGEWKATPDEFFFHVKIAGDLLDFSLGREIDNKSGICSDVRIPEWSGRVIVEEITSRSASYHPQCH